MAKRRKPRPTRGRARNYVETTNTSRTSATPWAREATVVLPDYIKPKAQYLVPRRQPVKIAARRKKTYRLDPSPGRRHKVKFSEFDTDYAPRRTTVVSDGKKARVLTRDNTQGRYDNRRRMDWKPGSRQGRSPSRAYALEGLTPLQLRLLGPAIRTQDARLIADTATYLKRYF